MIHKNNIYLLYAWKNIRESFNNGHVTIRLLRYVPYPMRPNQKGQ